METLSVFPRLLEFQKWLGFMILDVNSCSNLAFTGQEQCQGWPSEPRWQQNLLGKQAPTKRLSYNHTTFSFFSSLRPLFWPRSLVILRCLAWKSSAVTDSSLLSSLFPYHSQSLLKASESVSPAESEQEWGSVWMGAIKCVHGDFWRKIQLIYILNFLTEFPEYIKTCFSEGNAFMLGGK